VNFVAFDADSTVSRQDAAGAAARGSSMTRSEQACATHGRIRPCFFSSALMPGHSMLYRTRPLIKRHRQVRQVPLRQELGRAIPAARAAASSGVAPFTSNDNPTGSITTAKQSSSARTHSPYEHAGH
jgi:hypothetical protein